MGKWRALAGGSANLVGADSDQPIDPLDPTYKAPGLDLTQEQCTDLTAFVASLPPPRQRKPSSAADAERVNSGARLFTATGCADCHMEKLGSVNGIYSDLLLHDMGTALADPAGAGSGRPSSRKAGQRRSGYFGESNDAFEFVPPEALQRWRTPPLWGVADSAPYLHDGRAATLQDAIMAHGGEAIAARKSFAALPAPERRKIVAFLNSLTVQ
jgi:CxxC motif-containing protein (DUF1111 family)